MKKQLLYPIGIQNFEQIRTGGYAYVDKTAYVWRLVKTGNIYFLSRPRRFGKSLLLSTIQAYFEGRKDLFEGLAIDGLEKNWYTSPVIHLDFNAQDFTAADSLDEIIGKFLDELEESYGIHHQKLSSSLRFEKVIAEIHALTGRQVVVLIDEYDKPLLMNLFHSERQERFRNVLKGFYGVLKSCDEHIRFAMLTGVTKFGRVSVFSDLNNLNDISLQADFNGICGITESELTANFKESISELALATDASEEFTLERLRRAYDGYRFTASDHSEGVYNPFSLLNVFYSREYGDYWFSTGTPTLLVDLLRRTRFNLSRLSGAERDANALMGLDPTFRDPVPVIFQSGYLTIKSYDERRARYVLDYPNSEVERGFLNALLPYYANRDLDPNRLDVFRLIDALESGDVDTYMNILISFMAGIPYDHAKGLTTEARFHDLMYLLARLTGLNVRTEYHTSEGSIDMVVFTARYIYVMEFKIDRTPLTALRQIERKHYADPFASDSRTVVKVGVQFATALKNIKAWKAVGLPRR